MPLHDVAGGRDASSTMALGYLTPTTTGAPGSTNVYAVRVWLPSRATFSTYLFRIGTSSGNMDLGLYDAAGNAIRREGSFAVPGTGRQTRAMTGGSITLEPAEYVLAMQADNSTVTFGLLGTTNLEAIVYTPANTFPLPATLTLTVGGSGISLALIP